MVETRSGKMQDPAQERIQAEESAKPQPGATIGRDASSDPVVLNPNIDIPKYDGTEDPRPWIESLEEIGFLYHWADYIISRYAAMNMTGSAKTWLNLHKASFTSWENIKIRLIQDFSLDANKEELRMKLNRMQHWNEPAIRFAEDILVLCNKVDPAMEEETKIEHVIGGLKKEYSFALYLNPPKTTDDLLVVCKKMDYFEKKYRERVEKSRNLYNGPRYSRPQQQSRYVPPTAARNYQTTSRPQAPVSNNYKNDSPPTPRQYRNNFPQPSTPRRPYNPNFVPKPNLQRNTYNKSQEVSKNRTEDGRPICFKCNKPGHVARYCRVKFIRILEEDPADTQEKHTDKYSYPEYIFRVGRFKLSVAPESVNQSKSTINGIKKLDPKYKLKINVDKIGTFEALVDTGADLSVVDLRTALDTGHGISKLAKICAGPDGKKLDMVGSIFLNIKIDDETLSHNFVILKTHLRTLILGRDFLKKMNAKIDCKQETIKYDLTNNHDEINFEMLKIKSAKDSIVPECSMKLIKALVETEDGEYIIEESSKMFQTNGLRLARSLINVINRETHIWITNPYPRPLKIMKNQTLAFGSSPAKMNVSREREVEKNEEPRFQINENLSPKEQKELKQVLERYGDLFSSRLGRTNLAKHRIDTEDAKPIKHKPYRVSAKERDIIKEQIDEMLTEGIIRPSSSPWSFPVILVKKRDGKYRFCVDYRKLNNVTVKDVYPIPRIDEVMDTLQGSTHFSAIDLRSGYWQVEVEERDKEKTAFTTAHGLYEFNVMPFGLCNAPATFERNMENMLGNLRWQICLCYLDDVIIYSPDFPTHLKRLEAVFRCFRESNLRLNDKKCRFAFEELEILGYITSKHGIKPAEHNIKAVRNFPRPKKVKEVQSFLGMCSYYRKFIKDFSKIADPLTNLIKKGVSFTWTERQEEAFQTLKTALLSPPILGHFNPNAPTYVHTDASNIGIGATLVQDIGGEEKVISYLSRTLSKAEQNYSTTEKECLAVVWSMSKLRPYLYGRHFKIVTDHHALCWLKNLKDPTGRLARWALKIQEYDFDIIHKSGKKHLDADGLSRGPLPETDWDEDFERLFLNQITDEEDKFIESVKKNLNGSRRSIAQNFKEEDGCLFKKNPNPEGRAWLLVVPENKKREIMKEYHNHMSNGHLGVARTMYRIKSKYFWPSMLKDVSEFVKTCHLCQSRKGSNQLPSGLLQPIPPANFPFERIGIDFVGPLPSTKNRKKWIIVLTDYYTRYAETRAVSEATVKEVSKFLVEDIFLRHGAPQYLISDRGSQFTSNLMKEVMKTCKIKHCFTTSYHPQTNGLTERLNRTLINMLSMYVNTDQKNWDEILPFITHAYNTTIQETTGYSPFFLMFGREPTSLLDDRNISVDIDKDDYDEYIKHHLDKINRTRKLVINNTIKTQERMKKNYDKKHMERSYEPGELVAVWTPIRKIGKCEKLLRKYFGPYRILKKLSNVNYLIEPKDNPGQDPLIVHVSRLKPYFERIDEVTHEDVTTSGEGEVFLRPPDLLVASRWAGMRVGDLTSSSSLPLRTTRAALADIAALTTFCSRIVEENRNHTHRVDNIKDAIVLRGTATAFQRLTTRTARRMLERPRLAALPITQLLARWLPHVSIPISISWPSLRRGAFSGHNADVDVRLALHALPHPAHPASARDSCIACGSEDLSLAHRYWSCRRIRPVILEAFTFIRRPPDLQGWIFGHDLEDDALAILASAKTRIFKHFLGLEIRGVQEDPLIVWRRTLARCRNWADIVENDGNFEQPKKRKRLLPSESASQSLPGPSRQTKTTRDSTTPRQPSCPRNTIEQIKVSWQMLAQCRSKAAAGTYDQMTYLEFSPEFTQVDYIKALENKLGKGCVVQIGKASGQILVGFERPDMAETIIEDGLMIKGALLKALPYQKKAEKITISGLPFVIEDADIIRTLRPYCQGGSALAYLEYGFRCSKCYRMGHKRMNCPRIIRETSTTKPLSQTSSVKTTAPAPNTTAAASPPATFSHPAPVAAPAQTSSAPPALEDIALETEPTTRTPETSTQTDLNINRVENSSHHKIKDRSRSLSPKAGSTTQLQLDTLLERLPGSFFEEVTLLGLKEEEVKQAIVSLPHLRLLLGKLSVEQSLGLHTFNEKLIKGLGSSKSIELCCFLKQHAVDIAFIQETNVTTLDSVEDLCLGYRAAVVPASGARGSGLACIFSSGVQVIGQQVLSPGKIAAFDVTIRGSKATFVNCHLSHAPDERLQQLQVIAAAAVNEDAWVLGDLNISEESASDIVSGSVEALGELLDQANLVDAAAIFDATHLPTRISSCGSRVDASRLDRVLIPSSFSNRVTRYWSLYYKNSDHRAVLLQTGEASEPRPPCVASMLRSRLVVGTVETLLDEALGNIEDMRNAEIWRRWGHIKAHLASAIKSLHDLRNNDDDYISRARKYVQAKLEDVSIYSDYPSLPDLGRALRLRRRGTSSNTFYDSAGRMITGPAVRELAFVNLKERFSHPSCSPEDIDGFLRGFTLRIPIEESDPLHRYGIGEEEIVAAIGRLPTGKAAGWDDLPCELFRGFEDYFASALRRVFEASQLCGALPTSMRRSEMSLIEKPHGGPGLAGLRPLSLPTTDYRVLSGVLYWRLRPHLRDIVPECQSYAVPGRTPAWNIARVADEVATVCRDEAPLAVVAIDLESAFDTLDRGFLVSTLLSVGLPPVFVGWVLLLYAGAEAAARIEGIGRTPLFHMLNGVRQGCAASAAFFTISTGPLLLRLEQLLGRDNVLAYADDIVLLIREDGQLEVVRKIFEDFRRASGIRVNFGKSQGLWCGRWRNRTDSPSAISWNREKINILGTLVTPGMGTSAQDQHLQELLERAIARWSPFVRGLSLAGRAKAANSLVLSAIYYHLQAYLPSETTIGRLQARLARFVWGHDRTSWLPSSILARPITVGGMGLLDVGTQLRLSCLKGVQAALRGGRNAHSWLAESGMWLNPASTPGIWLPPRRRRSLHLFEPAAEILDLNHRILQPALLRALRVVGDCRFLRPPELLAPTRWLGWRIGELTGPAPNITIATRGALTDVAALGSFCTRLITQNARGRYRVDSLADAIVVRGTTTAFQRLTTRTARRLLERPRLAALPITQLFGRWFPHVSIPISISWSSLRRCAFSGHNADVAVRLALHALPHPAHPASARESCIACGSGDLSLAHRYWSCSRIRPVILEAFTILQRPPDLQSWIFGHDLEDDALAIMASAKTRIYKHFLGLEMRGVQEDPLLVWRRTLSRWSRAKSKMELEKALTVLHSDEVDLATTDKGSRRCVVMKSNREFENRAAIIVALRAGRSPKEIVDFLKLPKTTIYRVKKQFDEADSNKEGIATRKKHSRRSDRVRGEEFVKNVKEKIDGNPGKSMRAIAKEMDVGSMTIVRTIHEDLGLKSYALRKGQLLTENMKNNRKGKAAALLNNLKHDSFGKLRFFSDEKNFDVDQKVNLRNDRWICKDPSEIPVVMHTKFPASVMVLGVISSEGDVMPPHFFEKGLRMNADTYINVLETVVKPWMDMVAAGRKYVFQQDSAPAHKAKKTQSWLTLNVPSHWGPDIWPPNSPDCNPLDYYVWGVVERDVNKAPHTTIQSVKKAVHTVMTQMDKVIVAKACASFRTRLKTVVANNGNYIE
ncbi:hypothetical protein LAZ67_4002285 [Cordylochernes scorpioides]|uniref:RNA-directed DNA polymerase n=1 Tax=Cordylochernes scorpioides TaxID=51811 RepID=A0ABY6KG19_9ARAC|nr:hypothetical protein LAZ67_4002285 [Cordylochernes scorpioides]